MTEPHLCQYVDGSCPLPDPHGGVPFPDPADARIEDFQVVTDRDGDTELMCAHYAEGCWWAASFGGGDAGRDSTLGVLLGMARQHLAEAHVRTVDGTVTPTV